MVSTLSKIKSIPNTISAIIREETITTIALDCNSAQLGQDTLYSSSWNASSMYFFIFIILCQMAREERLERPTPGFGDQCSTN